MSVGEHGSLLQTNRALRLFSARGRLTHIFAHRADDIVTLAQERHV